LFCLPSTAVVDRGEQGMFITTPFIRYFVNRLYESGKLDLQQRDQLILQDRQFNVAITGSALFLIASLFI
jgi:hypothetical protein